MTVAAPPWPYSVPRDAIAALIAAGAAAGHHVMVTPVDMRVVVECTCGDLERRRPSKVPATEDGLRHLVGVTGQDGPMTTAIEDHEVEPCPECKAGKHPNCDGHAWDTKADRQTSCPCAMSGHAA